MKISYLTKGVMEETIDTPFVVFTCELVDNLVQCCGISKAHLIV
jgi:hypothetical protein